VKENIGIMGDYGKFGNGWWVLRWWSEGFINVARFVEKMNKIS
jgi:hypothetical protein